MDNTKGDIKKKVLIVEDEESLRSVLSDALMQGGFEVIQAKDGREGVMQALANHPDLILLDILMPRMDGKSALKALREKEDTRNIPIIFLTNLNELDTISDVVGGESTEYIVKSDWGISEIVDRVKNKLK